MSDRTKTEKFQGVYYRDHPSRKHNGKPDRCFDISYKNLAGKKIWEKVGWRHDGYTAEMAAQVRAERIRALRHGDELPDKKANRITFGDLWKKYSEWAKLNTKAFSREENRYRKHLKKRLENTPVAEITPALLEEIKLDMQKEKYAPATVRHVLTLVRTVINKGVGLGLWNNRNPVKQVNLPKLNNKRERYLTQEQADNLLDELGKVSRQWHDIALLGLHTGLRAGEIFALRWNHIDLDAGIITLLDTKNGQSQKAFMTETAKKMLAGRQTADTALNQWVFSAARGKHRGEQIQEVSDTFKRTVARLGLNDGIEDRRQKVCFHTLRHTFASWLALEGVPILTIKELMRHASLAMTERYSHLIPDHKRQAINVIEAKLNQPSEPDTTSSSVQEPRERSG